MQTISGEDLEAKVVRLYLTKGYLISMFGAFRICSSDKASEILNKYGLIKRHQGFRGKYGTYDHT